MASDRVSGCFADDDEASAARRALGAKMKRASSTLVIHFTPRSGSSWLSSVLESTRGLGTGLELFNPSFMANIAKHYGARSLSEYIEMARYFSARGGVLSFEITSHQLRAVFRNSEDFFHIYDGCPSYWLIREDIVSQAISLAKMVKTGVGHAPQADSKNRKVADDSFSYDAKDILKWLNHILVAERSSEKFFADHGVTPYRISYERMMGKDARLFLSDFSRFAGLPKLTEEIEIKSSHEKIGTRKNNDFADRFRHEHRIYLDEVAGERSAWLQKLDENSFFKS